MQMAVQMTEYWLVAGVKVVQLSVFEGTAGNYGRDVDGCGAVCSKGGDTAGQQEIAVI